MTRKPLKQEGLRITFQPIESRRLTTLQEDDPIWAFFTGEVPEPPVFETGQIVRLFVPLHATEPQVRASIEWLQEKVCAVRVMPRRRTVAPVLEAEHQESHSLRSIADAHVNEVWDRVWGPVHLGKPLFMNLVTDILNKVGV